MPGSEQNTRNLPAIQPPITNDRNELTMLKASVPIPRLHEIRRDVPDQRRDGLSQCDADEAEDQNRRQGSQCTDRNRTPVDRPVLPFLVFAFRSMNSGSARKLSLPFVFTVTMIR